MTEIKNNRIIHQVKAGTDSAITVRSSDLIQYDEVRMDIKYVERIDADAEFSFSSLDGGILYSFDEPETVITIPLSNSVTANLKANRMFFDIKFRIGATVSDIVIPGEITAKQTVTSV
jgi:hypothetical protein